MTVWEFGVDALPYLSGASGEPGSRLQHWSSPEWLEQLDVWCSPTPLHSKPKHVCFTVKLRTS